MTDIAKAYSREYLLSFQQTFKTLPTRLGDVIQPLFLDRGSSFNTTTPTKAPKTPTKKLTPKVKSNQTPAAKTQALVKTPLTTPLPLSLQTRTTVPAKAVEIPLVTAQLVQNLVAKSTNPTPKRVPFATIPKVSLSNKLPTSFTNGVVSINALKNQMATGFLNKENLLNMQPKSQLVTPKTLEKLLIRQSLPAEDSATKVETPVVVPRLAMTSSELDEHRLAQRQKQLDYGFKTVGYQKYLALVPKNHREPGNPQHPQTPRKEQKCSKRSWDGQVRKWRRALHAYDPNEDIANWEDVVRDKFGDLQQAQDDGDVCSKLDSFKAPQLLAV